MKALGFAIIASLFLAGCSTSQLNKNGFTQSQVSLVLTKCPVLQEYSKEELKQAASELESLPSKSQAVKMIGDYGKLRKACRVIKKKLESQ